ncbi:MAG: ribosome recycling factor [Ignavibacteria bacterium]|jgi:ribosome recycling factor|nr:ribosome recycling factor [Ignavibacteria bacterium]
MTVKENLTQTKDLMQKALEYCNLQISKVRTGRATASLLDGVKVDYYGSPTPVSQVAGISTPDARTIIVQPFDRTTLSAIDKAIQAASLGFNPQNDGTILRIPVPPLTEERRKEFVKMCKKHAEDGKIAIRNIRRDQIELLKKAEKNKEFAEDDRKKGEDEIQKLTDQFIKNIDTELAAKEKDLTEV